MSGYQEIFHSEDVRKLAKDGYDKGAHNYLDWVLNRSNVRPTYIEKLLKYLPNPAEAKILELGCGAGIPCTKILAETCGHVVANDISSAQIALAKEYLSGRTNVKFAEGDMTTLDFSAASLDAVTAFYSIIHLDPAGQVEMLAKIWTWLKSDGLLLCNLAGGEENDPGTINEDWLGMRAYWSSFGRSGNLKMVADAGFEILEHEITDEVADASFLWIIARKISSRPALTEKVGTV